MLAAVTWTRADPGTFGLALRVSSLTRRCHRGYHAPSTTVVVADSMFSEAEQFALAGFLAGYRGLNL